MEYSEVCLTVLTVCCVLVTVAMWTSASAREALDRYELERTKELDRKDAERKSKGFE